MDQEERGSRFDLSFYSPSTWRGFQTLIVFSRRQTVLVGRQIGELAHPVSGTWLPASTLIHSEALRSWITLEAQSWPANSTFTVMYETFCPWGRLGRYTSSGKADSLCTKGNMLKTDCCHHIVMLFFVFFPSVLLGFDNKATYLLLFCQFYLGKIIFPFQKLN